MMLKTLPLIALASPILAQNSISLGDSGLTTSLEDKIKNAADRLVYIIEEESSNPDREVLVLQTGESNIITNDVFEVSDDYFVPEDLDEAPQRWTDESRPWTKTYSQFRRAIKVIFVESVKLRPDLYKALGPNEPETNYPRAANTIPKVLRNYGCWCMPRGDRDWANGHGAAVDEVDQTCKELGHCVTCTQLMKNCYDVTDQPYAHTIEVIDDASTSIGKRVVLNCKDNDNVPEGKTDCLKMICECQAHHLQKIVDRAINVLEEEYAAWDGQYYLDTDKLIKSEYSQKGKYDGTFEFETCKKGKLRANQNEITHTPESCCGQHPTWKVFDSRQGTRRCCGKHNYDPVIEECVQEGDSFDDYKVKSRNFL